MENWHTEINTRINSKLEGVKDRDIRFFRVDEFIRNVERTDNFSGSCSECLKNKQDIEWSVEKIDEAIKVPGQTRREFDRLTSRLSNHQMKKHGFYAPYYFTYLYSFLGMVAGLVIGYLGLKLFPSQDWIALIVGFSVGLLSGQFMGSKKDKEIRRNKKLM